MLKNIIEYSNLEISTYFHIPTLFNLTCHTNYDIALASLANGYLASGFKDITLRYSFNIV